MSTNAVGWTAPIASAKVHADPSGVQQASTNFQALLLPGMSTVTPRLRYISLFTAARFYRMEAVRTEDEQRKLKQQLSIEEYLRRFEALVAVCTIHHHLQDTILPDGIVGVRAMRMQLHSQNREIELKSSVQNPPYFIYRGTLNNLRIFNTSESSDPLREHAIALGKSWDIEQAGQLGLALKEGVLPAYIDREDIAKIDKAFCLCSIPDNSSEQDELTRILFAKDLPFQFSSPFASDNEMIKYTASYRSLAWRFVLELIDCNQDQPLGNYLTLTKLLDNSIMTVDRNPALKDEVMAWRWVAARTFFERGWTGIFQKSIEILKQKRVGLSTSELIDQIQQLYLNQHQDETVESLYQEVKKNASNKDWLKVLFTSEQPRDFLLSILLGLYAAKREKDEHCGSFLDRLWFAGPISFSNEDLRAEKGNIVSELWSKIAEEALMQHFSISLRKMSDGNPDSLLIDFDAGKWKVRDSAYDTTIARAEGFTRLDIAFSWAVQLGLVKKLSTDVFQLTSTGHQCCIVWDRDHQ